MSLLQAKDGLLDPKGSFSSSLPSKAIALANKEVEKGHARTVANTRGEIILIYTRLQHLDLERCGAPSHISALLQ